MPRHPVLEKVTARVVARSAQTRQAYLDRTRAMAGQKVERANISCTNLAHGVAAMPDEAKIRLKAQERPNLAIVSAGSLILLFIALNVFSRLEGNFAEEL